MNKDLTIAIFFLIGLGVVPVAAQSSDERAVEMIRRLVKSEPQPCPDKESCYCVRYTAASNIPVRYAKAKYCLSKRTPDGFVLLKFTAWDECKNKVDEGYFLDEKMQGLWISWHPNGNKAAEGQYENGKQIGTFTTWHESGEVAVTGQHKNGRPDGEWLYRDRNGRLEKRLKWEEGALKSNENL